MKKQQILTSVLVLGLLLALAVGLSLAQEPEPPGEVQSEELALQNQQLGFVPAHQGGQGPGLANVAPGQQPTGGMSITARPTGLLNYQGQLLQDGKPYNGDINITFRLYYADTGGTAWWEETQTVSVDEGLFNVMLGEVAPLDDMAVYFKSQQWLGVQPAGAASELTPRQPLGAVGYAMNLMPGATMLDFNDGAPYWASFYVQSANYPAIYGYSGVDAGVRGQAVYTDAAGVEGIAYGHDSHGVAGYDYGDTICPIGDTDCGAGVYGTASGSSYASFFYGENASGIIGVQGDNIYYGLWLYSLIEPNGGGIWTNGESRFEDYVTFDSGKSGYVVDIALNDGDEPLEQGDVVVISGYDAPVVGNIPVVRVQRATGANATGVIGVVDVLYVPCTAVEPLQAGQACGGFEPSVTTIRPGEYLAVVTLGAYEAIKVDATSGPIRPGDLLATSTATGYATRATPLKVEGMTFHAPGTIVGTAIGALDKGTGVIPVFVSSR